MPVPKKPGKKAAKKSSVNPSPPDLRGMEGIVTSLLGGLADNTPINAAQEIMYNAWDATSRSKRIALAKKALVVSPLCADAYVLLAEEEAETVKDALELYRRGVEAGEKAIGPAGFDEYAGHFWGFLETRPYMRARAGLAGALWQAGQHQEALDHYQAMLELNPNDNQGIRYVLSSRLLARNAIELLKKLIRQYEEDGSAAWLYTQVLLAYRDNDPDAEKLAEDAWLANSHVPGVLVGKQPLVASMDGYITMGGEDEAASYVEENGKAWQATPGAAEWLARITAKLRPRRRRG